MDNDDALAATANALNEDAKAERRKRRPAASKAGAVDIEPNDDKAELGEALASLGNSVNAADNGNDGFDLSEGAHTTAIERQENMATEFVLDTKALVYDIRDFLLDQIKARPKPWSGTSNIEQKDVAAACEHAGRELIRKVLEATAAAGKEPVRVLLTKVTIGEDIVIAGKVKTFTPEEENAAVDLLHKARGKHVVITVASVDDYAGNARSADVDPDQADLGFDAGNDEIDH